MSALQMAEFGKTGNDIQLNRFFLACECQPGTNVFASVIDQFAYDVEPAYIFGGLGIMHYNPSSYGIISLSDQSDPLFGYIFTVTHEDTIALLDRLKGFYGSGGINYHIRVMADVVKENGETEKAWIYAITDYIVSAYETIEQVDHGIWNESDQRLIDFMEKFIKELEEGEEEGEEPSLD